MYQYRLEYRPKLAVPDGETVTQLSLKNSGLLDDDISLAPCPRRRLNQMKPALLHLKILLVALVIGTITISSRFGGRADDDDDSQFIIGRVVAMGIPGASAVTPV